MKAQINKKQYTVPQIELIVLDSEISLTLDSTPPAGPGETGYNGVTPEYLKNDPFKTPFA